MDLSVYLLCLLVMASCAGCAEPVIAPAPPAPQSFAYVLQAENLAETREAVVETLAACGRDWIVLDASYTLGPGGRWRPVELDAIRAAHPGRKILCYLSIGEAERYRSYWRPAWDPEADGQPGADAPAWLLSENPDWPGNYRVRYWDPGWQALILSEVDRIAAQGFDGLWLDIVDAFETFERAEDGFADHRINDATGQSFRRDMVDWIDAVARRMRQANPGALLIPQNGAQLLAEDGMAGTVSGLALEDLFSNENDPQPAEHSEFILTCLAPLRAVRKPVLLTEYAADPALRETVVALARRAEVTLLLTTRALDALGVGVNHQGHQ